MDDAEFRAELLEAFAAECRDHLAAMRAALADGMLAGPVLRDVFRRAHSLKGAARAVELGTVETVAHELETMLQGIVDSGGTLDAAAAARVARALDAIEAGADGSGERDAPSPGGEAASAEAGEGTGAALANLGLRIGAPDLDRLVAAIEEVEDAGRRGAGFAAFAAEAGRVLERLRRTAGPEAGREIAGLLAGLRREEAARQFLATGTGAAVRQLREVAERVALVEIATVLRPLAASIRELGRERGVELAVPVSGADRRVDRRVLQALRDPLLQVLRNAVAHNCDPSGVCTLGTVAVRVRVSGGRLRIEVADDGGGPDLPAIAATARRRGLLEAGVPEPDEAALLRLVFEPGFSTAATADRLSGRGFGLSIVAEAVRRLRGAVWMRRAPGGGTEVGLEVPLPARRQTLLLVGERERVLALPVDGISGVRAVRGDRLRREQGRLELRLGEAVLPASRLGELEAGAAVLPMPARDASCRVVLIPENGGATALLVERLLGVQTLLVREPAVVGLHRDLVDGIAVIDGTVPVPVLMPERVLQALRRDGPVATGAAEPEEEDGRVARKQPTVLVVDDSITTRTLEKAILQAQGYRVLIAVDGIEALTVLRTAEWEIDVVVADVEMPRLDGFGLLAAMRDDPVLARVPTVLMTSRNAEADIRRGLELGARAYLAKQDFDQGSLLATINGLLP